MGSIYQNEFMWSFLKTYRMVCGWCWQRGAGHSGGRGWCMAHSGSSREREAKHPQQQKLWVPRPPIEVEVCRLLQMSCSLSTHPDFLCTKLIQWLYLVVSEHLVWFVCGADIRQWTVAMHLLVRCLYTLPSATHSLHTFQCIRPFLSSLILF